MTTLRTFRDAMNGIAETLRRRVTAAATDPFGYVPYPLASTLDHPGDPGLCGPGSVSWRVIGDVCSFVGGLRALLIQAAHPEVVAGVGDHSRYHQDPLGRLSRTSAYVTATTFGAMPEVEAAVAKVRRVHRPIKGHSERGLPYDAADPYLSAWVHNALTDSFLVAYRVYGPEKLGPGEEDRFVTEQMPVGRLLDADPMPESAGELTAWIDEFEGLAPSAAMDDAVDFLRSPPLERRVLLGYRMLFEAAVVTIPDHILEVLGLKPRFGAYIVGKRVVEGLRWALGNSISWHLGLIRCGAEVPEGMFRQPLPVDTGH